MGAELSIEERQRIALESHISYVRGMHHKFGLASHPGYCYVELRPLLASAGGFFYDPDTVCVNDTITDDEEILDEVVHESGHFLHPFAREEYRQNRTANYTLREIVVHLGSLIFLDIAKGRSRANAYLEGTKNSASHYEALMANDVFESDSELLAKIANCNLRETQELITSYLKRPFKVFEG